MALNIDKPSTKETNIDFFVIALVVLIGLIVCIPLYQKNKTSIQTRINRVLNTSAHVVILSTYGPSVKGSPFYEKYIEKAITFILDPKNKVDELIVVGGYTVDPNTSQSQTVLNYIKEKYPEFNTAQIPVTLDECGITTWQNIKNSKKLMEKNMISPKKITIFAEESRLEKVYAFAFSEFIPKTDDAKKTVSSTALQNVEKQLSLSKEEQLKALGAQPQSSALKIPKDATHYRDIDISIITEPSGLAQEYIDEERLKIMQETKEFFVESYGKQKVIGRLESWSKTAGFNTVENLVQKGCVEYKEFLKK